MTSACAALVALLAAASSPPPATPAATLRVANREIVTFRATVVGNDPAERALIATQRIDGIAPSALEAPVTTEPLTLAGQKGFAVLVGGRLTFYVVEGDRDPTGDEATARVAGGAAERLGEALRASRAQRSWTVLWRGAWQSGLATLALALALLVLRRVRRTVTPALDRLATRGAHAVGGARIDVAPALAAVSHGVVLVLFWSGVAVVVNLWVTFVLGRFPLTAPWADVLTDRALGILASIALSMLQGIPGLFTIAVIFVVARFVASFIAGIFERVERGALSIPGLYPETIPATRRIVAALVWVVALAAAYPYIPGSDSEAVKGLSLLVGVMFSLGSSGLVTQAMSGLALIYSRALSAGDVVRIGDAEGVVTQVGLLSTKLLTIPGEEVTFPNSVVLNGSVRNFTRLAGGSGPLVTTAVTIGYDAPWRQVHALLLAAAAEAEGLARDPAPFVLQRTLGDFYVEYQLVARLAADPADRPRILSVLHGKVQDAFNAAGLQIMSPHFVLQPKDPVLVPRERWGDEAAPPADPARRSG
jgi:small-conductance mechanosensitive channel